MVRWIYGYNGWVLGLCFEMKPHPSVCCWLLFCGTSNSERDATWLTAWQKQRRGVISQWVKISTKSYWLTGEKRDGGQWARLWDLAVVINTGVLPEGASDSVFIQSDTGQRSTIVQPHWCCQSRQGCTAGGVALADTHTHVHTLGCRNWPVTPIKISIKEPYLSSVSLPYAILLTSPDWSALPHLCLIVSPFPSGVKEASFWSFPGQIFRCCHSESMVQVCPFIRLVTTCLYCVLYCFSLFPAFPVFPGM